MAPVGRSWRDRWQWNDARHGPPPATHFDYFTPLHVGEYGGEMVLDVTDIERFHVIQIA